MRTRLLVDDNPIESCPPYRSDFSCWKPPLQWMKHFTRLSTNSVLQFHEKDKSVTNLASLCQVFPCYIVLNAENNFPVTVRYLLLMMLHQLMKSRRSVGTATTGLPLRRGCHGRKRMTFVTRACLDCFYDTVSGTHVYPLSQSGILLSVN